MPYVRYKTLYRNSWREMILITTEKTGRVIYGGPFDLGDEKLLKLIDKYCPDYLKKYQILTLKRGDVWYV